MSVTTATSGPRQRRVPPEVPVKTKRSRWLLGVLGLVLVGGISTVLARHWPYSEAQVVPGLQDTFKTTVTIGHYRRFYFPHPGCELEVVRLERPTKIGREKPLATVQKIRITGRYSDLLFRPYHLARIEVNGLRVRIPAPGEPKNWNEGTDENDTSSRVSVGRVITDGAVLEIEKEKGEVPLKFEIHKLQLDSIAAHEPMDYEVSMGIPEPPGELESKGKFGPWEDGEIGKIPLSGSVKLSGAKLRAGSPALRGHRAGRSSRMTSLSALMVIPRNTSRGPFRVDVRPHRIRSDRRSSGSIASSAQTTPTDFTPTARQAC